MFFFTTALSLFSLDFKFSKYKNVLTFYLLLVLALIAGLRSSTAASDYSNYMAMFYLFDNSGVAGVFSNEYFFEPGFAMLILLVRAVFENHISLFLIVAFISSLLMYFTIRRLTLFPCLAVLVFFSYDFFTNYMVAIRFGIAAALGLVVLIRLSENKKKQALLFIFIALSFHTAAIALFAPLFLTFLSLERRLFVFCIIVSIFIGYSGLGMTVFSTLLPSWIPRASSAEAYTSNDMYGNSLGFLGFINVKYLIISAIFCFKWSKLKSKMPHFEVVAIYLLCTTSIRVAFHDLGFITGRITALLGIVEIVIVPAIAFSVFKQKLLAVLLVVLYALTNLIFILWVRGFNEYSSILTF